MELIINLGGLTTSSGENHVVVRSIDDIEKAANAVRSAAKQWMREVPLNNMGSRLHIDLRASWQVGKESNSADPDEPEVLGMGDEVPGKPRRRKRGKK